MKGVSTDLAEILAAVVGPRNVFEVGNSSGIVVRAKSRRGTARTTYRFEATTRIDEGQVALGVGLAKHPRWQRVRADIGPDGHGQAEVTLKNGLVETLSW